MAIVAASDAIAAGQASRKGLPAPHDKPCEGVVFGRQPGALPFDVGEELVYDLSFTGIRVGKLEMKVGKPRTVGGKKVFTLFGRARTNTLVAQYQPFTGRWMSFIDPSSLHPVAVRVESQYGEDRRWEKTRFADDVLGVKADFHMKGRDGSRVYDTRDAPLFDLLALLYFARTRTLKVGVRTCNEVYAARRLWRMDAHVLGYETLHTPVGDKRVFAVQTKFDRVPHPDFHPKFRRPHIDVLVYLADDETRAPLAFVVDTGKITGRGDLVRWSIRGSSSDADWQF